MEITRPTSLAEALEARAEDPGANLLAGGTDLMVEVNSGHSRPEHVIALRRCASRLSTSSAEMICRAKESGVTATSS